MEKTRDFVYNQCKTRGHQFRIDQSQQLFASYCFKRVISRVISRKIHDFTWFHYNDKKKRAKNHQKPVISQVISHTALLLLKKKKSAEMKKRRNFLTKRVIFPWKSRVIFLKEAWRKKITQSAILKKHCWTVYVCVGPSC